LGFFNDLDKIFVLFDSEIESVALILKVFNALNKQLVLVRTKCDNWKADHAKTIEEELANDLQQVRKYYPACNKVYGVGKGSYENIRLELQ
jgi:Sec7-like guanine-nucleotide exchange factor